MQEANQPDTMDDPLITRLTLVLSFNSSVSPPHSNLTLCPVAMHRQREVHPFSGSRHCTPSRATTPPPLSPPLFPHSITPRAVTTPLSCENSSTASSMSCAAYTVRPSSEMATPPAGREAV